MHRHSHIVPDRPETATLDHTRTATTRRNGMLASCEPCRKSKIRCDHRRPICGPCRKRSAKVSCQYQGTLLSKRRFIFHEIPRETGNPPQQGLVNSQNLDPVWNEHGHPALDHTDSTPSNSRRPTEGLQSTRDELVDRVVRIVNDAYMRWRSLSALVRRYHQMSIASLVPPRLLESFLSTVDRSLAAFDHTNPRDTMIWQTAENILDQTAAQLPDASSTTVADFETYWDSSGVRLETLGLLCTLAARACVFGLQDKTISHDESSVTEDLFNIGEQSLSLLRTTSPRPNDVWLWFAYEHLKLLMAVRGTKHHAVWRALGELTSDVYSFGIHSEPQLSSNTPWWLAELRRRCFIKCYHIDGVISRYLSRPQRLLRRFSDCALPLDLSDDELLALGTNSERTDATNFHSSDPHVYPAWHSASWARLTYLVDTMNEELLDYLPIPASADSHRRLSESIQRFRERWAELPDHLRYAKSCWTSPSISTPVCSLLIRHKMNFLSTLVRAEHLASQNPGSPNRLNLYLTALDAVKTVLELGIERDRDTYLRHQFEFVLLHFGVQSATLLASALTDTHAVDLNLREVIRNLSMFGAYLDGLFPEGHPNHIAVNNIASSIDRAIDHVLAPVRAEVMESRSISEEQDVVNLTGPVGCGATTMVDTSGAQETALPCPDFSEFCLDPTDEFVSLQWLEEFT